MTHAVHSVTHGGITVNIGPLLLALCMGVGTYLFLCLLAGRPKDSSQQSFVATAFAALGLGLFAAIYYWPVIGPIVFSFLNMLPLLRF